MERDSYMLSLIHRGVDTLKSVGHSILQHVSVPTTPQPLTEIFPCTMCESSLTCDMQNEHCMANYVGSGNQESGTTSTPSTPHASSRLSQIDDESINTVASTSIEWSQRLREKYGINKPMEDE